MTTIAVLGAGNLGHAVAGFLGMAGHAILLWNRDAPHEVQRWILPVSQHGSIELLGANQGSGPVEVTTGLLLVWLTPMFMLPERQTRSF